MRRALSSTDAGDLLRAERDVQDRLHGLGIDVDLDFVSMAAVANVFRVASAARGHLERTVLADAGLSFTAFTVMWVLWVWGEMESRELAIDAGVTKGTLDGRRRHARAPGPRGPATATQSTGGSSSCRRRTPATR